MAEKDPATRLKQHMNAQLLTAVQAGDIDLVLRFLEFGASPGATCRDSLSSACHVAALEGHAEVLRALLRAGANPVARNRDQHTPSHMASWAGHLNCIQILESAYVLRTTPLVEDSEKCSDLHDHLSLTKLIPAIAAGSSLLHVVSMRLHKICFDHLIRKQPDVSVTDDRNMTALDVAGTASSKENFQYFHHVVSALLNRGRQGQQWDTMALITAASRDDVTVLRALLAAGAAPGVTDDRGDTALHVAGRWHCEGVLRELLRLGCIHVDQVNSNGETVLHIAVANSWPVGVDLLLVAGAAHHITTADGNSVLHLAAAAPSAIVLRALLDLDGINQILNLENGTGETALVKSIHSADVECVGLLIRNGAAVKQHSALLTAVLRSSPEIVRLLLEAAPVTQDEDNILSLETDKLSLEVQDDLSNQSVALQTAVQLDNVTITKALIERYPSIIEKGDEEGMRPIHKAILSCSRDCAFLLLSMNADLTSEVYFQDCEHTTLSLILTFLPRPMRFLRDVFDSCITINDTDINDYNCCIKVNYGILLPKHRDQNQMKVLETLLNSNQQICQLVCSNRPVVDSSLILKCFNHPLVESFLILKWKKLRKYFLLFLVLYILFATSLTTTTLILQKNGLESMSAKITIGCVFLTMVPFYMQEIARVLMTPWSFLHDMEWWLNMTILLLTMSIICLDQTSYGYKELSMVAVLLSWVEVTFLLSRFPTWGQYIHMFSTVAFTVFKIMLSLSCVLVGFTACFTLLFDIKTPWTAILNTIAIMTGDFSYDSVHDSSGVVGSLIFISFILFVSIIMMNLMFAIAVSDIASLENEGKARRLMKQAQYLASLDRMGLGGFMRKKMPKKIKSKLERWRNVEMIEQIYPGRNRRNILSVFPHKVYMSIIKIALEKKRCGEEVTIEKVHNKLDDLHNVLSSLINKNK